jgi:hypothetical protein
VGGPWFVTSPLSISLFHNLSAVAKSLLGQTPQGPSALEEPTTREELTASEEPAAPEIPAVPEEPAASRQPVRLKLLPPKAQNQRAEDEDTAMAVDSLPPVKVSMYVYVFLLFSDCIGIPLSAAGSERLPTQLPP